MIEISNVKNHMIISIEKEHLKKNPHSFIVESLNKAGIEGMYLNIVKAVYDKPIANSEKLKAFLLRSGARQVPTLATVIQHSIESTSN